MTAHGLKGYVGNERSSLSHRWYRQPVLRNRHHVVLYCASGAVHGNGLYHSPCNSSKETNVASIHPGSMGHLPHCVQTSFPTIIVVSTNECSPFKMLRAPDNQGSFYFRVHPARHPVHPSLVFVITNITMCCTYKRPQRDTCVTFAGQCHGLDDKAFIPTVVSVSAYFTPTPFCIVLISASISDDQLAAGDIYHLMYSPGTVIFPPHESSNLA